MPFFIDQITITDRLDEAYKKDGIAVLFGSRKLFDFSRWNARITFLLSSCPVCQNGTPSNVPRYRNDELDDKKDATS